MEHNTLDQGLRSYHSLMDKLTDCVCFRVCILDYRSFRMGNHTCVNTAATYFGASQGPMGVSGLKYTFVVLANSKRRERGLKIHNQASTTTVLDVLLRDHRIIPQPYLQTNQGTSFLPLG